VPSALKAFIVDRPRYLIGHLNPAPGDQLQNQDGEGNNEQNVNQTARDVKTEAKRPKNKKNSQDVPKHRIEALFDVPSY
jgi:hypothetical protein